MVAILKMRAKMICVFPTVHVLIMKCSKKQSDYILN